MIKPAGAVARSRNLGHTFLANSVAKSNRHRYYFNFLCKIQLDHPVLVVRLKAMLTGQRVTDEKLNKMARILPGELNRRIEVFRSRGKLPAATQ